MSDNMIVYKFNQNVLEKCIFQKKHIHYTLLASCDYDISRRLQKNPTYGRHQLSRAMWIVEPIEV